MKKLFSDRSAWWSLFLEMFTGTIPLQFLLNILGWTRSTSNPTFAPLSCPKPSRVWYSYCCYFSFYSFFHLFLTFLLLLFIPLLPPPRVLFLLLCCSSNVCVEVSACMRTEAKKERLPVSLSTIVYFTYWETTFHSVRWLVSESRNPLRSHSTDIRVHTLSYLIRILLCGCWGLKWNYSGIIINNSFEGW